MWRRENASGCSNQPSSAGVFAAVFSATVFVESNPSSEGIRRKYGLSAPNQAGIDFGQSPEARNAATTWPRAMPPSFGGTRWCQ